jgi:hypothetical protein
MVRSLENLVHQFDANNSSPIHWVDSRGQVMIVIPKLDHRLEKIVLITERAQARRAQRRILPASPERGPASGRPESKRSGSAPPITLIALR